MIRVEIKFMCNLQGIDPYLKAPLIQYKKQKYHRQH